MLRREGCGPQAARRSVGCAVLFGRSRLVGERSESGEAGAEAFPWSDQKRGCCDEYARNRVKTPVTVSLRVPEPCRSAQGQSVPKVRPRGVTDGKRVNIPVPRTTSFEIEGGRRSELSVGGWLCRCKAVDVSGPANPSG